MPSIRAARFWATLGAAAVLYGMVVAQNGPSIPVKYCATVNTGDMNAISSDFQSQGRCFNNCTSLDFSLAIVQARNCWCANLVPNRADQKPLRDCQSSCPGYPDDYCGGPGTFGYMQLKDPQGTASPGTTNTKISSSRTVQDPVTWRPDVTTSSSSSLDPIITPPINDDISPTATPSVQTVTVGGVIKTVTATPVATGGSSTELTATSNSGLSTGATVGIAVGVIGIFAVGAVFVFMYCLKRKRRETDEGLFPSISRRGSSPGMLSTPKTGEVSEQPRFGDGPNAAAVWDMSQSSKRRSHLMPVDPRLDPFAKGIYVRDQNKSHDSIGSLQDNRDYSRRIQEPPRVLRATNPDPDD